MTVLRTILSISLLACLGAATPFAARADSTTTAPVAEYLWVLRSSVLDSASAGLVVERAHDMGVRALLVQVVGRGDAIHQSQRLPRCEAMEPVEKIGDPFAHLIDAAHANK